MHLQNWRKRRIPAALGALVVVFLFLTIKDRETTGDEINPISPEEPASAQAESPKDDAETKRVEPDFKRSPEKRAQWEERELVRLENPVDRGHPDWPGGKVLGIGESAAERNQPVRRVTLVAPAELPYPIRVEEFIQRNPDGTERVLTKTEMVANRFILKPENTASPDLLQEMKRDGLTVRRISSTGIYRIELAEYDFDTVPEKVAELQQNEAVAYAEPDSIVHLLGEPDDPDYLNGILWGMHNTGQSEGTEDADIDAPEGWAIRTDAPDIIVGMVDTGVRYTHEDIADNMWINPGEDGPDAFGNSKRTNGIDDDENGYVDDVHGINAVMGTGDPFDDHGHGSHTAGTVAAVGNNGIGVTGVAWKAQIMALKFLGGSGGSSSDAVTCIDYAIQHGAHITSNSWGGSRLSEAVKEIFTAANKAGQVTLAAAGNSSWDNDAEDTYPANYPLENLISVAAINRRGELASFSNFGAGSVHLAAPGQKITSLDNESDSAYADLSGTSMATPAVAGIAALVMAQFPEDDNMGVVNRILSGAVSSESLTKVTMTGGLANLHGALTTASPSPFNDDFEQAMELRKDPIVVHANNHHATPETGEPIPSGHGSNTVWFRVQAKVAGLTIANTAGSSFDTNMAVYAGETMEQLVLVGTSDDTDEASSSRIDWQAVEGTVYHIAVAGKDNQSGFIKLTVSGPPVEDFLADALAVPNFSFTYTSDNTNASKEPGEAGHAGLPGGGSLWLKLRLADHGLASQEVVLSTRNSEFDTVLAVYTSSVEPATHDSLIEVTSNDDAPYGDTFSEVSFFANAQTTYYIVTDGKDNGRGLVRMRGISKSSNDDFDSAFVLSGDRINVTLAALEFRLATREPEEPNHDNAGGGTSLWYRWSPDSAGDYEIRTNSPIALGIYTGSALNDLISVATDESSGSSNSRAVLSGADPQTIYHIAVDSRPQMIQLRDIELSIRPHTTHPNDTFTTAHHWTAAPTGQSPLEWKTNNDGAERDVAEPGSETFQTVWIEWTAPISGDFQLETVASEMDTYFNVYTGSATATNYNELSPLDWNKAHRMDADLWARYAIEAGTTYYIQVGSLNTPVSGSFTVRLQPFTVPQNDDFANAEVITDFFAARPLRNFGATRSGFEPRHSTNNVFHNNSDLVYPDTTFTYSTLWYKWTPATAEQARRTTASSFFSHIGSVIAVYEGPDDAQSAFDLTDVTEGASSMFYYWWNTGEISWQAEYGKTYYIVLGTDSESNQGKQYLSLWQNPNDNFADREMLVSRANLTWRTANFAATRESLEPRIDSRKTGGRSVWYEWIAPRTGTYAIDTYGSHLRPGTVAPLQVGVYTGTTISQLRKVAGNAGVSMRDSNAMITFEAEQGHSYKIVVDGQNGPSTDEPKPEWVHRAVIQLNLSSGSIENDNFENAKLISGDFHQEFIDLKLASFEPGEPTHASGSNRSAWWRWIAPADGTWWVATASDIFDTQDNRRPCLGIYRDTGSGDGFERLEKITEDNNLSDNSNYSPALASFSATAGQTYYLAVADLGTLPTHSGFKSGLLLARPAANDDFASATEITGSRRTVSGHNLGATWQEGEPQIDSWGTDSNQGSVWWKWTAPADGLTTVTTDGSFIYNELAVYTGASLEGLTEVAKQRTGGSFDNGFSYEERAALANRTVSFNAVADTTYYFMVVGSGFENTAYGPITLTVLGQAGIPFAPTGLAANRITASRVDLTWKDNAVDESTYVVHKASAAGGPWREIYNSGEVDTVRFTDLNATAGAWYRVRAQGRGGNSEWTSLFVAGPPVPAALTSIDEWRQHYFGSTEITDQSADYASPHGDGFSNLLKYALGAEPWASPDDIAPFLTIENIDGLFYLVFHYRRHTGIHSGSTESGYRIHGLEYVVRVTTDPSAAWHTGSGWLQQLGEPEPNANGTETVRLRVGPAIDSTPQLLVRLEVKLE